MRRAKVETSGCGQRTYQIERWPIGQLRPYDRNARTHTEEDVDKVVGSIVRFGFTIPVLVDETGEVIAGHCRLRAAQKLQMDSVPVIVARGWSRDQKAAYCIVDNQLAARAEWNFDLLREELGRLMPAGFTSELLGFDPGELNEVLGPTTGQVDPDALPALETNAVTTPGDTWILGRHRVHCGDCTDAAAVASACGGNAPVMMTTDPPYGVEYDPVWRAKNGTKVKSTGKVLNDERADWGAAWALFPGSVAYVWHGALHASVVVQSLEAHGFKPRAQIIWVKQHFAFSRGDYHWKHEACYYAVREGKKSHWSGDRKQTTVWEIANNNPFGNPNGEQTLGHGTQKPIECMKRPILNNSQPGDTIYDPFLGTGTTLIAAEMTGRTCVGLELSPVYVDMIVRRWQAFTGRDAILEASGRSFAKCSGARVRARPKKGS